MSQGDDPRRDDVEFLDVGPKRVGSRFRRLGRRPSWMLLLAGVVTAAAVIAVIVQAATGPSRSPAAHGPTTLIASPPSPFRPSSTPTAQPTVVTEVDHPLLGARRGWEVVGRSDGAVVRIDFARDRITRTSLPTLLSTGPVSFLAGSGWALVRPLDFVPGYLITDGQPVRLAPGTLHSGGPAFPGPDARHVWIPAPGPGPGRMLLVGLDGRPTGASVSVPAGSSPFDAIPDQRGNLLFPARDGVEEADPGAPEKRVTARTLLAVGPTRLLTGACDKRVRCRLIVLDRATSLEHPLNAHLNQAGQPTGVISPDGTSAAVFLGSSQKRIDIINLATGAQHTLPLPVNPAALNLGWQTVAWSPDSRWLLVVAANGHLDAVDAAGTHVTDLTVTTGRTLPNLIQLAVTPAPTS